jgi:hypothetical protein
MEKTELKQEPDGKLTLFTMGLRLDVQPYWLVKGMINQNSQDILDEIIEREFKNALNKFSEWQNGVINSFISDDDADVEFVKYKRDVHVHEIQNIADISRHLLMLHSDSECIGLTEEQQTAQEIAYSYWKYNSFYGYETTV